MRYSDIPEKEQRLSISIAKEAYDRLPNKDQTHVDKWVNGAIKTIKGRGSKQCGEGIAREIIAAIGILIEEEVARTSCPSCHGDRNCIACGGTGTTRAMLMCSHCSGTGMCRRCRGTGKA